MYSAWTVKQLKEKLKERGASLRGRKSDLIDRLVFYDENHNFGHAEVVPDEPTIVLPPLDSYRDVNSDSKLPPINRTHIRHYLNCSEKKYLAANSLYESRHLLAARLSILSNKFYIKGYCRKTMKALQYEVNVKLDIFGNPEESNCECPAGSGTNAVCKHVAVLLLAIEHMVRDKIILKHEVCTEKLQQFHVPRKQYTGSPMRAEKLPRKRKICKVNFEPYPVNTIDKINYNNRIRNLVLNYPNTNMPMKQLYAPANPHGIYNDHTYTPDDPQEDMLKILNLSHITNSLIQLIQYQTTSQSNSTQWHELRRIRLTASKFHTICHLKPSSLSKYANTYMDQKVINTKATSHGKVNECVAIAKYCNENDLMVQPCGLFIYKEKPYLAASPDGLLGEETIIEVKCPFSCRSEKISPSKVPYLEIINDELQLKKTSPYYYQVQGQLLCSNRKWCNFIIYTYKDMKVIFISRDEPFIKAMVEKLDIFFNNYFKQIILEKYLYYNYEKYSIHTAT